MAETGSGEGSGGVPEDVAKDSPPAVEPAPVSESAADSTDAAADENDSETDGEDASPPEAESKRRVKRRELELGITARATLLTEAGRRIATPDGTLKEPTSETEEALTVYYQIGNKKSGGLDFGTDGNPLSLPEITGSDLDGESVHFDNGQASVSRIIDTTEDGSFVCEFADEAGRPVTKSVKNADTGEDEEMPVQVIIPREVVLDAQFLSQSELYVGAVEGDQRTVLEAHADTLPQSETDFSPGEDLDSVIDKAAREAGQITVTQVRESTVLTDEQKAGLEPLLKDKTLLTADDMRTLITLTGADRLGVRREVTALLKARDELAKRTDPVGVTEREEVELRLKLLEQLDNKWKEAEKNGGTPYDSMLQAMQDGTLPAGQAECIINALVSGDVESLISSSPELKNLTPAERHLLKEYGKKGGKSLLWILAGILGTGVLAAGAVAVGGVSMAASAGKH